MLKGDPNEAPATVGVSNSNVNRPYITNITISPALRLIGQAQSLGELDYHGFLAKFQHRRALLRSQRRGTEPRPKNIGVGSGRWRRAPSTTSSGTNPYRR